MNCAHDNFKVEATTVRSDTLPVEFRVEFYVECSDCKTPFRFEKAYISSTDGLELTAQIKAGARKVNRPLKAA